MLYKVAVKVPAVLSNIGPGLHTLGMALGQHVLVEMNIPRKTHFEIVVEGEGKEQFPTNHRHPTVRAATRLFQHLEMAPAGLQVSIENHIPPEAGLWETTALTIGGLVAANNLTGNHLGLKDLIRLALELDCPLETAVTAVRGGLNLCVMLNGETGDFLYNNIEIPPLRVVVVVPEIPDYAEKLRLPEQVAVKDAIFNMGRVAFLIEVLREAEWEKLSLMLEDRLHQSARMAAIPGADAVKKAALDAGATAVTVTGKGPAMVAFAEFNHNLIAQAMIDAFQAAGVANCRSWIPTLDGQGVTVSVAQ